MLETLDIFVKMEDGTYEWKAAETLEVATSKIEKLATTSPSEYVIFDRTTGNEIVVKPDGSPELARRSSRHSGWRRTKKGRIDRLG